MEDCITVLVYYRTSPYYKFDNSMYTKRVFKCLEAPVLANP